MFPALARVGMLGKQAWPWIVKGYHGLSHVGNAGFLAAMLMNPAQFLGFGGSEGESYQPEDDGPMGQPMNQRQRMLEEIAALQQRARR